MKKIFLGLSALALLVLAACNLSTGGMQVPNPLTTATLSAEQMQTQMVILLTQVATATGQTAGDMTATAPLPTVAMDTPTLAPGSVSTATPVPTETEVPTAVPSATLVPPTATLAPTATEGPTAAATQPTGPTFTPDPADPRARLGAPTSTDTMDNATTWVWPTGTGKYTSAAFSGGYQSVTALTGTDGWRMANPQGSAYANLYLEGTFRVNTCAGSDHYGLITRVPVLTDSDQGYLFSVTCDGRYSLRRWNGKATPKGEMKWLVDWTANAAIAKGPNQINRLGMMTSGSRLLLYANGKLLTEVADSTYATGYFGMLIGSDVTKEFTVQIDEMAYWVNPKP